MKKNRAIRKPQMNLDFSWYLIVLSISMLIISCTSQSRMTLFQSQYSNLEMQIPKGWVVQDSIKEISIQHEEVDAGITIISNPPHYMENNLQYSLEKFISSDLLPNTAEVLTSSPMLEVDFNGYKAVQGEVVANVSRSETLPYARQFNLILAQNKDGRILIIAYQRGGTEMIFEDVAKDINDMLGSISFK